MDRVCVEFYELKISTIPIRNKNNLAPPYEYAPIKPVFESLESNLNEVYKTNEDDVELKISDKYWIGKGRYSTSIQFLEISQHYIKLAISCFDKEAPDRTLHHIENEQEEVQTRGDLQAEKVICHCVIKFTDNSRIATLAIERVNKFPVSIIAKYINALLIRLKAFDRKINDTNGVFCADNADGFRDNEGQPLKLWFKLKPTLEPLIGDELINAVIDGRLSAVKVSSWSNSGFDDPNNDFSKEKEDLIFSVQSVPDGSQENIVRGYLRRVIEVVKGNRRVEYNSKTSLILEHEQTGKPQVCQVEESADGGITSFSEKFIRRKYFDPSNKRQRGVGNTTHNNLFFETIKNLMDD
ncbi:MULTISPECIES: hypothetical protein [unclassified Psychrobacter]|uniref:hypothetical protein n=1 Tax=unclassified Psychrobacter TaxID=196806 RepID=UPI000412C286|nr:MULTISPECIES: hypothetical protein [unclassified Psychrobacter]